MGNTGFAFQEELPGNTDFACLILYIHKSVIDNKHYP